MLAAPAHTRAQASAVKAGRFERRCSAQTRAVQAQAVASYPASAARMELSDLPKVGDDGPVGVAKDFATGKFTYRGALQSIGEKCIMVNMGVAGGTQLVVDDADLVNELLHHDEVKIVLSWPKPIQRVIFGDRGIERGHSLQRRRAVMSKMLSWDAIYDFHVPVISKTLEARFQEAMQADGEIIKFFPVARGLAMEVSMRFVLGDALTDKGARALMADYNEYAQGVFSSPYSTDDGVPHTKYWRTTQARARMTKRVRPVLNEYIDKYLAGERLKTVLGLTFRAYEDEGINIADLKTDPLLEDEIVRLAFSGTDAPSGQICEAVKFVARHPEWFERLAQEQAEIIAKHGPEFSREAIKSMAVAYAITEESLRVFPAIPLTMRSVEEELVTSHGLRVPAGTRLVLMFDKATLATGNGNPNMDPQQWIGPGNSIIPNADANMLVFGGGKRQCLGDRLAKTEVAMVLALLARNCEKLELLGDKGTRAAVMGRGDSDNIPMHLYPRTTPLAA